MVMSDTGWSLLFYASLLISPGKTSAMSETAFSSIDIKLFDTVEILSFLLTFILSDVSFSYSRYNYFLRGKDLVFVYFTDILAYLKESIRSSFSKLLACQTCIGKYDCK